MIEVRGGKCGGRFTHAVENGLKSEVLDVLKAEGHQGSFEDFKKRIFPMSKNAKQVVAVHESAIYAGCNKGGIFCHAFRVGGMRVETKPE